MGLLIFDFQTVGGWKFWSLICRCWSRAEADNSSSWFPNPWPWPPHSGWPARTIPHPGSASGTTQAQEAWHRHKLKRHIRHLRQDVHAFVESLQSFTSSYLLAPAPAHVTSLLNQTRFLFLFVLSKAIVLDSDNFQELVQQFNTIRSMRKTIMNDQHSGNWPETVGGCIWGTTKKNYCFFLNMLHQNSAIPAIRPAELMTIQGSGCRNSTHERWGPRNP